MEVVVFCAGMGLLGLLIGSFLNVVIHRLPKMMEANWAADAAELAGQPPVETPAFNLMTPRSRCPHCGHGITWAENIPLLSYLVLRGRCANCKAPIGLRYPAVELFTGLMFAFCGWRFGMTATALVWCGFCAALTAAALIDWDTTLLPDVITLPLLWAGMIAAAVRLSPAVGLHDALWGAVGGYMSLWSIFWLFKLATGKDGMGFGDFKLFAALGAWFGFAGLVPIILMASVIGTVVGIGMKLSAQLREGKYIPFGPFLAGAGFAAFFFGPQAILRVVGLG